MFPRILVGMMLLAGFAHAQETPLRTGKANTAEVGTWQPEKFMEMHAQFLKEAEAIPDCQILFMGDSITDGWRWKQNFKDLFVAKYKTLNFGRGGDQTQHVLWRIQNGEMDKIKPKLVVLMIGTNNLGQPPAEVAGGVLTIIDAIHAKSPESKVLLLAVFPRGANPADRGRVFTKAVNAILGPAVKDNAKVRYLDIGDKFLQPDGTATRDVMPDLLHLSDKGYDIWAENIVPVVEEMVK
jgi:lysophospholipase L1-like esterase